MTPKGTRTGNVFLPQSGFPVQGVISVPEPEHGAPDPDGAGLSQFLVLVLFPLPQVVELKSGYTFFSFVKVRLHYGDYRSKLVRFESQKKYFLC